MNTKGRIGGLWLAASVFLLLAGYTGWANLGRTYTGPPTPSAIIQVDTIGHNTGRGNLLGIQPWMKPADYANVGLFSQKMDSYLEQAQQRGLITPRKTIVVLPEYLGTWLVAIGEKTGVYTAPTVQDALTTMVLSNPIPFMKAYRAAPDSLGDKTKYAVFAMKGPQMAAAYTQTFAELAHRYGVTIVAGSILLPNPSVQHGQVVAGQGPLYNVSVVFRPDGQAETQLVKKVYPIADELPFVCPTLPASVPVFDTPAGRLGVLVCADSWNSPVYKTLRQKGATLLAVPSYSAGEGIWQTVWKGYSGMPTPADARADVGKLTEGQAWMAHAMGGRARPEGGIQRGINVFLRGHLWDLGSDGTTVVLADSARLTKSVSGATLTCLWL